MKKKRKGFKDVASKVKDEEDKRDERLVSVISLSGLFTF